LPGDGGGITLKRILIVDDEEGFTSMLKLVFDQIGGYEFRELNDPMTAIEVAKEFQPDVIILDVMMPGMDGGDVASKLREESRTRHIPVLFVTALVGGDEVPPGGIIRNGHRYLSKTASFEELVQAIEDATGSMAVPDQPS
jgi:CheY-like chemotaxis protein